MTVRVRLLAALLPLGLALLAIGVVALVTVSRLGRNSETILRENYPSVVAAQAMKAALEQLDRAAALQLADDTAGAKAIGDSALKRFESELQIQEAHVFEHAESEPTTRLRTHWTSYRETFLRFLATPEASEARTVYVGSVEPLSRRMEQIADELLRVNQTAMVEKSDRARAGAERMSAFLVITVVSAFVVAGVLSLLLVKEVLGRLHVLTAAVERMDAGDFDFRIALPGGDEMSMLATRFNELAAHLDDYRRSSSGELLQAQESSQAAIDSIPDPVVVFGPKGYVVKVNRAAHALVGIASPAGARDPLAAADPALRLALTRARDHVLATGTPSLPRGFDEAIRLTHGDRERHFLPRATPIDAPSRELVGATVILQDVSELRRFDELKDDLVATVAHELRTPLTSLRMAILLCLERAAGAITDKQERLLGAAREECERLQATVDRLLDLARIQSGRGEIVRRTTEAAAIVDAAMAAAEGAAHERSVRIVSDLPGRPLSLDGDPERLEMALGNLLQNAIRYSPSGSEVRIQATAECDGTRFAVLDRGAGIAEPDQSRLFEKFYRVPGNGADGVGLGLAIAREIVTAHGGEIGVRSRLGEGSEFWFVIPARKPSRDA